MLFLFVSLRSRLWFAAACTRWAVSILCLSRRMPLFPFRWKDAPG